MKTALIFVSCFLMLIACSKPEPSFESAEYTDHGIIFETSLADTLPTKTFRKLQTENVMGKRVFDSKGNDVRLFKYEIEKARLIHEISSSPFDINAIMADTVCRKID